MSVSYTHLDVYKRQQQYSTVPVLIDKDYMISQIEKLSATWLKDTENIWELRSNCHH